MTIYFYRFFAGESDGVSIDFPCFRTWFSLEAPRREHIELVPHDILEIYRFDTKTNKGEEISVRYVDEFSEETITEWEEMDTEDSAFEMVDFDCKALADQLRL